MEIPEEAQIQTPAKKVDFWDTSIIISCMDLSKPDGEGEVTITSITIRDSETTLNFEGPIEGYGTVFVKVDLCTHVESFKPWSSTWQ